MMTPLLDTIRGPMGDLQVPTAEQQEAYNLMRQIEDEEPQPLDARLLLQNASGGSNDEHADFLQPPTPSQATTSPGSPSCASTTHSITRDFDGVDIGSEEPRSKKRRSGRQGPLTRLDRAKAALKRKLGACPECRTRKVTVRIPSLHHLIVVC